MTKRYDLTIRKGSTFRRRLRRLSNTKRPVNLTGYQFILQMRATAASSEVLLELSTGNSRITITPAIGAVELKLDDLRITKAARHTSSFSVPTSPSLP